MDWSKAKTILIVAFIITNILLFNVVSNKNLEVDRTLNPEFISQVRRELATNKISIDAQIPDYRPKLNTIVVAYEDFDYESLNRVFLEGKGIEKSKKENIAILEKDQEELVIKEKSYIYKNYRDEEKYTDLSEDKAKDIARKFLNEKNFNLEDMKLTSIRKKDEVYKIKYSKIYDDRFVEETYTNILVDKTGVIEFERLWVHVKDLGEREIYIDSAPKALLYLMGNKDYAGETIKDISLCYHFNPQKNEYLRDFKDTKEGRAVPAWRIEFESGNKVVVDEY